MQIGWNPTELDHESSCPETSGETSWTTEHQSRNVLILSWEQFNMSTSTWKSQVVTKSSKQGLQIRSRSSPDQNLLCSLFTCLLLHPFKNSHYFQLLFQEWTSCHNLNSTVLYDKSLCFPEQPCFFLSFFLFFCGLGSFGSPCHFVLQNTQSGGRGRDSLCFHLSQEWAGWLVHVPTSSHHRRVADTQLDSLPQSGSRLMMLKW